MPGPLAETALRPLKWQMVDGPVCLYNTENLYYMNCLKNSGSRHQFRTRKKNERERETPRRAYLNTLFQMKTTKMTKMQNAEGTGIADIQPHTNAVTWELKVITE